MWGAVIAKGVKQDEVSTVASYGNICTFGWTDLKLKTMTQAEVERMKETETLLLRKGQTFWHYSIVPFLLISPVFATIEVFQYYVTKTHTGAISVNEEMFNGYIWLIPAIAFYIIQRRRLKFRLLNYSVDKDIFKRAAEQTANELKWEIRQETEDIIIAKSGFSWRSWGEQITIIRCSNKILFNSICDPDKKPSITSSGMNKQNRKTFERFLISEIGLPNV